MLALEKPAVIVYRGSFVGPSPPGESMENKVEPSPPGKKGWKRRLVEQELHACVL